MTDQPSYHHGNLRRAVLDAAVEAIAEQGTAGWSLRQIARRAGVSHAAPAHHFGDKAGLLTAVAAEGYARFADALEAAGGDLHDLGLAYVRFAVGHRAYFEVMFTPALYRADDPDVAAARDRAGRVLAAGVRGVTVGHGPEDERTAGLAAWSIVHGFAHLWLSGALTDVGDDPVAAASPVIRLLFER
ncbi:TetR/AcrR family transcriptional regulator [Actinomadura sp. KC216]|uniref:TetR/AcrR family transcriptional regulator n=1 Tax=Actinomadura sp. KC216 TaxID=2530370 RepID=UPI0010464BEC|nr:TetR-like C-terminal domain-containing protein [Actinomadura sp. KC216]TDB85639.1 TetR/AcrR family transcriptional regulator [Actinomadura sp. KC216]